MLVFKSLFRELLKNNLRNCESAVLLEDVFRDFSEGFQRSSQRRCQRQISLSESLIFSISPLEIEFFQSWGPLGKRKPAGNLGPTLPGPCPHLLKKREGVPDMGTKPLKALRGYRASNRGSAKL